MLEWISYVLIAVGTGTVLLGSVGVNRLPDFFTRSHASGKPDTLGLMLVMTGLAFYEGVDLNTVKLLLIVVLVAVANPAAAHALGRAAVLNREVPWLRRDRGNG